MQEFDDSGATLVDGWRDGNAIKLSDILNHELAQALPELADLPLEASDLGQRRLGSYGGVSSEDPLGTMRINTRLPDQKLMDTLRTRRALYPETGGVAGRRRSWCPHK